MDQSSIFAGVVSARNGGKQSLPRQWWPETIETQEVLLRKAMEFLCIQEKPKEGLEVDFEAICKLFWYR